MPEGTLKSGNHPEIEATSGEASATASPTAAPFAQSGRAVADLGRAFLVLGRAVFADLAVGLRPLRAKLREIGRRILLRLREVEFRRAASQLTARATALWSRVKRWRSQSSETHDDRTKWDRWRLALMRGATIAGATTLVTLAVVFAWALSDVPWQEIAEGSLKPVVVLETVDAMPLVKQGPIQGPYAPREEFPPHLVDAVLTSEDRRFFEHAGIDLKGIFRAVYRNFWAGEVVQGGSTITQQLTKILYLERDRTWKRKIQEAVIALWLEQKLGKDEILTRYLNNIYLGAGATGVPAAARIYFDKNVKELTVGESAMLAGIIRAPSQLNPFSNPDGAGRQAGLVLDAMADGGKISTSQAETAKAEFARISPTKPPIRSGSWFADWVMPEAHELAGPYRGTIEVRTTVVPRLQAIAEKVVTEALDKEGGEAGASQAALVAMTPEGAVVAMVGGRNYGESQFNRAVTAMRQPGSAFKLFVYYAALKAGLAPGDRLDDRPITIDGWTPENYGGQFRGRVSLAEAFARSLNAATVALAIDIGIDRVIAAARELGIDAKLVETPSLALGSSEVSLLDLTGAYASVRAGIAPIEPWGIVSFHADGQPRAFRVGPPKQASTDIHAYQPDLIGLLRLVVKRGTGREADLGPTAVGKTGTSQNYRDAWFVGFTEPLVVGVWVGNDDETPMKEVTGGKLPARIWRNFMSAALTVVDEDVPNAAPNPRAVSSAPDGTIESVACNYRACAHSYRSFRPADCTYQPYRGQRRLCEK